MSTYPETEDAFKRIVEEFRNTDQFKEPLFYAIGCPVSTRGGTLATVRFPLVNPQGANLGTAAILMKVLGVIPEGVQTHHISMEARQEFMKYFSWCRNDGKKHLNLDLLSPVGMGMRVVTFVFEDVAPVGVEDATLKLYALSNRLYKPNTLNLGGIFGKLPNVVWQNGEAFDEERVDFMLMHGTDFSPSLVDKFPLYADCINPLRMGVRICDPHKVRLGAYLGPGTTVMPGASYINFNAGTEGPCMVEGRISSSAFVGAGSDVGGGASILGTLSGGNSTPISVGRNCLLEANSVLGVPVGDAVIIAAGTAFLASSRLLINIEDHPRMGQWVRGVELAGINAATIRRDDCTGELQVVRTARNIAFARRLEDGESILRADLHKN